MKNRPNALNFVYQNDQSVSAVNPDDEIDLLDIWRVLVKHKHIIYKSVLLFFILGCLYTFMKKPYYPVSTVLQIGSLHNDDKGIPVPIETTQDVVEKLKSAYIPFVMSEFQKQNPALSVFSRVDANVPKGSNIISIKTSCGADQEAACKTLINNIVQKVVEDHSVVSGLTKKSIEVKLTSLQNGLNSSREEVKFINAKKQRLLQTAELLTNQLEEKKAMLESARKNRGKITAGNATGAMLALQIDNEIKRNQELVDALEQRLTIGINQEHDDLEKAEKANLRVQNEQENVIAQVKNQLLSINNTKAVVPTLMASKPDGVGTTLTILIFVLAGLFIGLFVAFFLRLMEKTHESELNTVAA